MSCSQSDSTLGSDGPNARHLLITDGCPSRDSDGQKGRGVLCGPRLEEIARFKLDYGDAAAGTTAPLGI